MNRITKTTVLLATLGALLIPTLAVAAYSTQDQSEYPLGTVCGDALAGAYSTTYFTSSSHYHEYSLTFSVTNLVLSGGSSGTVSSGAGSLDLLVNGFQVSANFSGLSGVYNIQEGNMHVSFSFSGLALSSPLSMNLGSVNLPQITLPCSTPD